MTDFAYSKFNQTPKAIAKGHKCGECRYFRANGIVCPMSLNVVTEKTQACVDGKRS